VNYLQRGSRIKLAIRNGGYINQEWSGLSSLGYKKKHKTCRDEKGWGKKEGDGYGKIFAMESCNDDLPKRRCDCVRRRTSDKQ